MIYLYWELMMPWNKKPPHLFFTTWNPCLFNRHMLSPRFLGSRPAPIDGLAVNARGGRQSCDMTNDLKNNRLVHSDTQLVVVILGGNDIEAGHDASTIIKKIAGGGDKSDHANPSSDSCRPVTDTPTKSETIFPKPVQYYCQNGP